ncbi:host specificity factor TipJ family phage tail protein [soil metagenome]
MLSILNDPTGATGRAQHDWDFGLSMQDNIAQHLRAGADSELRINGVKVDPLTDERLDRPPSVFDQVAVLRRPGFEGAIYWLYAAYAALAVYTLVASRNAAGTSATTNDSPNNRLTTQTNIARAYQAIPDVYGYRRCWPDLIQPSTVEYIANIKYVTEWMCVSRGRGDVTDVRYAETPIDDISGSSYEIFSPAPSSNYPEFSTTTLSDVIETFASEEVNGQEMPPSVNFPPFTLPATLVMVEDAPSFSVTFADSGTLANLKSLAPSGTARVVFAEAGSGDTYDHTCTVLSYSVSCGYCTFVFTASTLPAPNTYSGLAVFVVAFGFTYTTIGPFTLPLAGSRIRWNTVFLRGLRGSVTIRAEWWAIDGGGAEIGGTRQTRDDTYAADTYDQQFFTREASPAAGYQRYRVQFRRLSLVNGDGTSDVAKLEELYAVRHYPTKVLPGVTVFRVTTKATEDATGFSDRKFNVRWQRHVRGVYGSTAVAPGRSFMRAMVHMWALAGNDVNDLDLAKLNSFDDNSPLLRFDASLDDADMSLGERMQMAADAARCTLWRDGQKWTVTRDQARGYPDLQFDYRNLAADGDSAISYAAHLPASNDGVEVEYVDEDTQAKKSYVRIYIGDGGISFGVSQNPLKIKMLTCATYAQALNRCQLEARKLLFQRVTVSDTALSDAGSLGLGSLVRWIDPNDFIGDDGPQAGEVLAIAGNVLRTSEALDWKGDGTGRILFTGTNGQRLASPVLCHPVADQPYLVQLDSVPAGLFVADGVTRQLGSRYAFAVGLTEAEIESASLYLVTSLKPDSKGNVAITLAEYDARIYADD